MPRQSNASSGGGRTASSAGKATKVRARFDLVVVPEVGKLHIPFVSKHLRAAHRHVAGPPTEMSLVIVGDATMSRLHRQYLGIAGPTDVLTFEMEHDASGRVCSGEVVICLPEAQRQATKRETSVERELLLYALHGLLHLSGFDDRTAAEYKRMHQAEDEILAKIGVGAVFAPAGATSKQTAQRRG